MAVISFDQFSLHCRSKLALGSRMARLVLPRFVLRLQVGALGACNYASSDIKAMGHSAVLQLSNKFNPKEEEEGGAEEGPMHREIVNRDAKWDQRPSLTASPSPVLSRAHVVTWRWQNLSTNFQMTARPPYHKQFRWHPGGRTST